MGKHTRQFGHAMQILNHPYSFVQKLFIFKVYNTEYICMACHTVFATDAMRCSMFENQSIVCALQ